jgi:Protein of unknown function (DUF3048) N-terminal domain/Protein of unknown function (DUF3048) C-terminal domain
LHTSKLGALAALLLIALAACGQTAAPKSYSATRDHNGGRVRPDPSPSPTIDYGPVPAAIGGPLPGQGLPLSGPLAYPLLVQVENTEPARPQAGLQAASVIFESISEGGITRFSALYHRVPGVVGPVRSARFVSVALYHRFGALLMASGGSGWTYQRIFADPSVPAIINDFDHGQHFFRWNGRLAPHNLYSSQPQLLAAGAAHARPDLATDFPRSGAWTGVEPAPVISVPDLRTQLDFAAGTYGVTTDGLAQNDVVYGPIRAQGVAVLHVRQWITDLTEDVTGGKARDFDLASGGAAEFYAHGTVVRGRWDSPSADTPLRLLGPNDQPVAMPPGLLWVSLAA